MARTTGLEQAIRTLAEGDLEGARRQGRRVARTGELEALASAWLEGLDADSGLAGAYADGSGFPAYGRGRSAGALLRSRVAWVARLWESTPGPRILDLGSGDGKVLAEAVSKLPSDRRLLLDVVEPSGPLMERARAAIPSDRVRAFHRTSAESFVRDVQGADRWTLGEAFLSLQSVPRERRLELLASLAGRLERFALIEFDVEFGGLPLESSERCRAVCDRYRVGIREYAEGMDEVTARGALHGFLMPMLFGSFRGDGSRSNEEQPIVDWIQLFADAGFGLESRETLCEHWWSRPEALVFRSRG